MIVFDNYNKILHCQPYSGINMGSNRLTADRRLREIRGLLEDENSVTIPTLAERFEVSEMTVRRDLEKLERNNEARRVHGGAMIAERRAFEFNFKGKRQKEKRAKVAIAREALRLIEPGQRIILDNGTTTLQLAAGLKNFSDLIVITTSLAVASELQFTEGVEVILTGGIIRRGSPDLTGVVAEHSLDLFSADIVFQGADAIDNAGAIYNVDMRMAQVDRKMRQCAQSCCVLADSTKIGKTALVRNGLLKDVDTFITDERIDRMDYRRFRKMGVNLIKAPLKPLNARSFQEQRTSESK